MGTVAEALAFPALAAAIKNSMENQSLSQNTHFNEILFLFISSSELSALCQPHCAALTASPSCCHLQQTLQHLCRDLPAVPSARPSTYLCFMPTQLSEMKIFVIFSPSWLLWKVKRAWHTAPEVSTYSKDFFFIIIINFEVSWYYSVLTSSEQDFQGGCYLCINSPGVSVERGAQNKSYLLSEVFLASSQDIHLEILLAWMARLHPNEEEMFQGRGRQYSAPQSSKGAGLLQAKETRALLSLHFARTFKQTKP